MTPPSATAAKAQAVAAQHFTDRPLALVLVPGILGIGLDGLHPIRAGHGGGLTGALDQSRIVQNLRAENSAHGPANPKAARQGARIDPLDADDIALFQIFIQRHRGAVVGVDWRKLLDDEAGHVRGGALDVAGVDAVVADQRISHGDDLSLV